MPNLQASRTYEVLTDELMEEIASASDEEQRHWLILSDSLDFVGFWRVDCLDAEFFFDFEEVIGSYRLVDVHSYARFSDLASSLGYRIAFDSDPRHRFDERTRLGDPPPFALRSDREGTDQGFYPWQLQGFNFLKDQSGKAIWSTGTGKTALAAALIRNCLEGEWDIVFYTAKVHNRRGTQLKLKNLAGIDSIILDAWSAQKRADLYADLYAKLDNGEKLVCITNYEKFREDEFAMKLLVEGRRVVVVWDEMPTKLSNRDTLLYQSVLRTIWRTQEDKDTSIPNPLVAQYRVADYRGYILTATPIENDPEGDFNCTRLVRPECFGSVKDYHREFVASYDYFKPGKPARFKNLDKMALKQAHFTHVVNKKDPDIAKFFPKIQYEPYVVDWHPPHRKVYDKLTGKATAMLEGLEEANVLALINVMQMMCDAPSMINISAENREQYEEELEAWQSGETDIEPSVEGSAVALELIRSLGTLADAKHGKLVALKDLVTGVHRDEHVLVYTAFGPMLLPLLSRYLSEWGVSHVVYHGSHRQRDKALEEYRRGNHQVWLSSDAGADSIDLELASVGIDYDLPWKYVTRIQRWNRANRVGAHHESQRFYSLIMADSIEDRKLEIIAKKQGYHEAVYEGKLNDIAVDSRTSREELVYILTGN